MQGGASIYFAVFTTPDNSFPTFLQCPVSTQGPQNHPHSHLLYRIPVYIGQR